MFNVGGNQQPGQQGQPHPTVPYGQDGSQQSAPPPTFIQGQAQQPQQQGFTQPVQPQGYGAPQQFYQQPQQPAPQQHPTVPYGQQPAPQQQQVPVQQRQQQQTTALDDNTILDGPNVPAELRGRTFGQFKSIYGALAQDWLTRQNAGRQQQGQQQQPVQQQAQQPQQHGQRPNGWDWSNPRESIGQTVREVVGEVLQPVIQQTQGNAVLQARNVAVQSIPDYAQLEAAVMQKLSNVDPSALTSPDVWINAARLARGELVERGQYNPNFNRGGGQNQPGQQQGYVQQAAGQYGTQQGFPQRSPAVPAQPYQFFTEAPTPPASGGFTPGTLTPEQVAVAEKMGMTPEQYLHWSGGIRR